MCVFIEVVIFSFFQDMPFDINPLYGGTHYHARRVMSIENGNGGAPFRPRPAHSKPAPHQTFNMAFTKSPFKQDLCFYALLSILWVRVGQHIVLIWEPPRCVLSPLHPWDYHGLRQCQGKRYSIFLLTQEGIVVWLEYEYQNGNDNVCVASCCGGRIISERDCKAGKCKIPSEEGYSRCTETSTLDVFFFCGSVE